MYQGFFSAAVLVSSPDMTFVGDVNYEGITRPHIQYNRDVYFLDIVALVKGISGLS